MALEQFILFTTDSVGLERILRLVHASLQIVVSVPLLLELAASFLLGDIAASGSSGTSKTAVAAARVMLAGARDRINLVRRFFRVFRFVDNLHGAYRLYEQLLGAPPTAVSDVSAVSEKSASSTTTPTRRPRRLDLWLDAFAKSFCGLYLLLETLTIVDALDVPGLAPWGPERARTLNIEGQRYWFLSLSCSVAATLVRMARVAKDVPLPPLAETDADADVGADAAAAAADDDDNDDNDDNPTARYARHEAERARLRRVVQARTAQRRVWRRAMRARLVVLGRRAIADGVDVILPGAIVGWTPATPATVGAVMFFTTVLTGYDVWLRCGREVAEAKAKTTAAAAA